MLVTSDPGLSVPANRILFVLGQTPFPVELLDHQGVVIYGNVAYTATFLGDNANVVGRPTRVLPAVMPDGISRNDFLGRAQREGQWKGEVILPTVSTEKVCFRLTVFPIMQPLEGYWEFAVFYEDIQSEFETREALVRQQNLLAIRSRQAQMGELLSMIAHQWRQPLTVVMSLIGNIQLKAQMGNLAPDYLTTKLDRISQTVHFLSETIDSFRNFYAPAKYKSEEDLGFLTRRALELLSPSLQKFGAQVELNFPEVPLMVRVFSGELVQVALELITNAREALLAEDCQHPVLRLLVSRQGDSAVLRVENNGGDIPTELLDHLYDPYYNTKEGTSGTGLGLYMAKLIVETHHGGTLTASSQGGWTSFTCTLPLDVPA